MILTLLSDITNKNKILLLVFEKKDKKKFIYVEKC